MHALRDVPTGRNIHRSWKMEMKVENRVLYALALAAIFISLINECDKENARLSARQQAESQLKLWENEGGAL